MKPLKKPFFGGSTGRHQLRSNGESITELEEPPDSRSVPMNPIRENNQMKLSKRKNEKKKSKKQKKSLHVYQMK